MKKRFFSKGDYILSEDGERRFQLKDAAVFNSHYFVVRAVDLETENDCMLKFVESRDETYKLNNLTREGNFQFYYPYIEQVYGNFKGIDPLGEPIFGVAVEYIDGMDLPEYRRSLEEKYLGNDYEELDRVVFGQIMQFLYGMNYYSRFAGQTFLHRDLKPENIRITEDGTVKIIDFDYSHIAGSTKTIRYAGWDIAFSTGYTSPEIAHHSEDKKLPDLGADIYSAGRVIFFWLNGRDYYSEDQKALQINEDGSSGGFESALYFKKEYLRWGIEANADRFEKRFLWPKYKKLRAILDKMCCNPDIADKYRNVVEIIADMRDFLLEYCGNSEKQLASFLEVDKWQLLQDCISVKEGSCVMAAYKIDGGKIIGKPLYENSMQDIDIDGRRVLTIYNLEGQVFYIPASGVDINKESGFDSEYRIFNNDILTFNEHEIRFVIG